MKTLLVFTAAVVVLAAAPYASAQQTTIRDSRGSTIGTATRSGNTVTFRTVAARRPARRQHWATRPPTATPAARPWARVRDDGDPHRRRPVSGAADRLVARRLAGRLDLRDFLKIEAQAGRGVRPPP